MTHAIAATAVDTPKRHTARIAGILYLVIAVAAIVAHIYVPGELIVPGDATATVTNISASPSLLRVSIGSEFVVLFSEIVLSVLLYGMFRAVNKTISLTAAVSRLTMTTIHGFNLLNYFFVLLLLGDAGYAAAFAGEQVNALVSLFLDAHAYGFAIGIAFLTIHVFALGYLMLKSRYVPKIFGVLFIIAGFGYFFDSMAMLLTANYDTTPVFVAIPIAVAELAFPIWLLVKGIKVPDQPQASTSPATEAQAVRA